jgi:hypothetical protein
MILSSDRPRHETAKPFFWQGCYGVGINFLTQEMDMFAFFKKLDARAKVRQLKDEGNIEELVALALLEADPYTNDLVVEALSQIARPLTQQETLNLMRASTSSNIFSKAANIDGKRARAVVALEKLGSRAKAAIPLLETLAHGNENETMEENAKRAIKQISERTSG